MEQIHQRYNKIRFTSPDPVCKIVSAKLWVVSYLAAGQQTSTNVTHYSSTQQLLPETDRNHHWYCIYKILFYVDLCAKQIMRQFNLKYLVHAVEQEKGFYPHQWLL